MQRKLDESEKSNKELRKCNENLTNAYAEVLEELQMYDEIQ